MPAIGGVSVTSVTFAPDGIVAGPRPVAVRTAAGGMRNCAL
jgi:hypothetical protein